MSDIYFTFNINLHTKDADERHATARAILRAIRELEWNCTGLEPFPFYPAPSLIPPDVAARCAVLVADVGGILYWRAQRFLDGCHAIAAQFELDYIDVKINYRGRPMLGLRVGPFAHMHNKGLFDADAFIESNADIRKPYDFQPDPYTLPLPRL